MSITRRLGTVAALAAAGALTGCIVSVDADYDHDRAGTRLVSKTGMQELVEDNKDVRLGMSRDEAIACYPAEFATLRGQTTWSGRSLETWQVAAWQKESSNRFERWLYFVDDSLVELSDERVGWRDNPDVRASWGLD